MQGAGISALGRHSSCACEKGVTLRLTDLVPIDMRLAVKDDLGAADVAGKIDARDHVKWSAGKAGGMDDIQGGEYVAGDLAIAIDGDGRRLAHFRPELFGTRPHDGHDLGRQTVQQLPCFGVCS